jgi:hypothetical protein
VRAHRQNGAGLNAFALRRVGSKPFGNEPFPRNTAASITSDFRAVMPENFLHFLKFSLDKTDASAIMNNVQIEVIE